MGAKFGPFELKDMSQVIVVTLTRNFLSLFSRKELFSDNHFRRAQTNPKKETASTLGREIAAATQFGRAP